MVERRASLFLGVDEPIERGYCPGRGSIGCGHVSESRVMTSCRTIRPSRWVVSTSFDARQHAVFPELHETHDPVWPLHVTDTVVPSGQSTVSVRMQDSGSLSSKTLPVVNPAGVHTGEMNRERSPVARSVIHPVRS